MPVGILEQNIDQIACPYRERDGESFFFSHPLAVHVFNAVRGFQAPAQLREHPKLRKNTVWPFLRSLDDRKGGEGGLHKTAVAGAAEKRRLEKLALMCGLNLTAEQIQLMGNINTYNLEGRYQGGEADEIDEPSAKELQERANEVYQWLASQL